MVEVHQEVREHRRCGEVTGECGDEFRGEFIGSEDIGDGFGGGGGLVMISCLVSFNVA